MGLLDKLKKNTKVKGVELLSKSSHHINNNRYKTDIPLLNLALSGDFDGGLCPGSFLICGDSKTFKTSFMLLMMKAFLDKEKEGVVLFYDCEFGMPMSYVEDFGIDSSRVLHIPITHIGEWKLDMMQQLKNLDDNDKIMIAVDSIGMMASTKELDDAENGKATLDMSRAKDLTSVFRMITPHLKLKNIPLVGINHYYETTDMYPKKVIAGGKKIVLSCNDVWIISASKDKEGREVKGHFFNIDIHKSRFIKENSKFSIHVTYDENIDEYSGIFDLAKESGIIIQSGAWYNFVDENGEISKNKFRRSDLEKAEYMDKVLERKEFKEFCKRKYLLKKKD